MLFVAYLVATLAGAPKDLLSLVFSILMGPVPFVVWWAYRRAPSTFRRPMLLLACAASLWLLGSVVWQVFYVAGGNKVPHSPGLWDGFFLGARLLVILGLVVAMRSLISFRIAALDASVIVAGGLALGAPFVRQGLEHGGTPAALLTLNRPILSVATLMLIVSAALGSSDGMPFSMALLGVAEVPLMVGNLIYSYAAVQGEYVDDRWANLAWGAGAIAAMLAAMVIVLGIDRRIRLPAHGRIPEHPAGSKLVLAMSVGTLAVGLGVACYGLLLDSRGLVLTGLLASVLIGLAMALRAKGSIQSAEEAYRRLDRSLAETERARDALAVANEELGRANVRIRAMHVAFSDLLNLADERANGQMRQLIEETGDDLARLLEDQLQRRRK